MKQRDKIITLVVVIIVVLFFAYRYVTAPQPDSQEIVHEGGQADLKQVSAENFYDVPGKTRHVRYNVFVDASGVIQNVTADDLNDPEHQAKMDEFSANLVPMVVGKNLGDIKELDMVGTSSLTTKSFNAVLPEIRYTAGFTALN